jgi:3-oxoacyl-(acyl-carrier-protein) synthase
MSEQDKQDNLSDIAIVGMAGRFPNSPNTEALWRNVRDGVECIRFFDDDELREVGVPEELLADPHYVKAHGYLEGIDQFDAGFFDISPREAEITDPQIRLFLEATWEALENAAVDPERYPGAIGVFAGASNNAYVIDNLITNPKVIEAVGYTQAALGNHTDFVATRASYKLDLRGPSVTVQTACSTSLVAIHMACQSLLSGESDVALSGGVCVTVLRKGGYTFVEGGTNTHDGHVRAFDANADGMLGGNGVAMVVLKRLEDAVADGDTIRAVIKGTAINNDGINKVTFTAPSVNGQAGVILDALDVAGVDPDTISMVEAHGTGTPLGDPIEIAALTQAWRARTERRGFCRIGSLKTNCGHMDIAAGVSGVIKTALSLQHRQIPPTLNFERPNPEIDFDASPFVVNTELADWPAGDTPRRAAVSSFGMGGTNAHAILEEAPEPEPTSASRARQLLLLSARTGTALEAATARLADRLEADGDLDLADVAHTLQVGRKGFDERRVVVAADADEAVDALRKLDVGRTATGVRARVDRPVAFLFTGQGAQYAGMMRGLYDSEATFRAELDRCCEALIGDVGRDLRELLLPPAGQEERAGEQLALTQYTQPALFAVEWSLAALWMEWGVEPDAMIGHSIGEYTAAARAGVFSFEDALRLVAARGRLIGSLPEGGAMMAVHLEDAPAPRGPLDRGHQRSRAVRRVGPRGRCRGARGGAGGARGLHAALAHLARLPLPADGPDPRRVPRGGALRGAVRAGAPGGVLLDRHVAHGRGGDRPRVLGAARARGRAVRRRHRHPGRRLGPPAAGGRPRPDAQFPGPAVHGRLPRQPDRRVGAPPQGGGPRPGLPAAGARRAVARRCGGRLGGLRRTRDAPADPPAHLPVGAPALLGRARGDDVRRRRSARAQEPGPLALVLRAVVGALRSRRCADGPARAARRGQLGALPGRRRNRRRPGRAPARGRRRRVHRRARSGLLEERGARADHRPGPGRGLPRGAGRRRGRRPRRHRGGLPPVARRASAQDAG